MSEALLASANLPDINDIASAIPELESRNLERRNMGRLGLAAALTAGAALMASKPAEAQTVTDMAIMNFTLNFEYLGAEYYLRALTGQGLIPTDLTGTGTQGTVIGGTQVPFVSDAIRQYAQRLAVDEQQHVRFLRASLGANAIAEPTIDLTASWTNMAIAAGLIVPGQTFNPFSGDVAFLLGAYVLEDVCVTALNGAVTLLQSPLAIQAAAGLLGVEAYQAGMIRTLLANLGAGVATNAISALRAQLSGVGDEGTSIPGLAYNSVNADIESLAFRRTPAQVLAIAYAGNPAGGGFFPNKVNGVIN